jgi:hypothetical protein
VNGFANYDPPRVDVELTPSQEPEVHDAIAAVVTPNRPEVPDPWWQDGIDEALET